MQKATRAAGHQRLRSRPKQVLKPSGIGRVGFDSDRETKVRMTEGHVTVISDQARQILRPTVTMSS